MAIREELVLDTRAYMSGLKEADRAAIKMADRREKQYKNASRQMDQLHTDIKKLKTLRDASNSPASVRRYEQAIESLQREYNQLERDTRDYNRAVKQNTDEINKKAAVSESGFKRIGMAAKLWIAGAATSAFFTLKRAFERAQEIEETASKYQTVLGPSIGIANKFIAENARLMGLSRNEAREQLSTITAVAQGMEFAGNEAAKFGVDILRVAGDLQSFNNVPIERTSRAIVSALTGEREALKTLGIVINEEMVKQEAMTMFRLEDAKAITQQQKAQATLNLIIQKAGVAIGDLERTASSSANRTRQSLSNIQDLLNTLSTGLNDNFGPTLIKWLENSLEVAENLVSVIQRGMNSDIENLIQNLEARGGNEQLISRLRRQQAISEAKEVKEEIEKELSELEVSADIVVNTLGNKIGSSIKELWDGILAPQKNIFTGGDNLFSSFTEMTKSFQNDFRSITEDFNPDHIDRYTERLEVMERMLLSATQQASVLFEEGNDEGGENMTQYANALSDAIGNITVAIAKSERLKQVNEEISNLQSESGSGSVSFDDPAMSSSISAKGMYTQQDVEVAEELVGHLEHINEVLKASDNNPTEMGVWLDTATRYASIYNIELTKLNNELSAGAINQKEFETKALSASQKYLSSLQSIYNAIKNKLTPEQQEFFKKLFANFKEARKETDDFDDSVDEVGANLRNIADAASGLLLVADAFGEMDKNVEGVIRGTIDLLRNMENLRSLDGSGFLGLGGTGLAGIAPAIGIAGSVLGIGSNIINSLRGDEENNDLEELNRTIEDQIKATERNTQALLRDSVVGSDTRAEDIQTAIDLINSLGMQGPRVGMGGVGDGTAFMTGIRSEDEARSIFAQLEDLFPEFFAGLFDDFDALVSDGGFIVALEQIQRRMRDVFDDFVDNFGTYGDSIEGAIQQFRDSISFGGVETQDAYERFISVLRELGTDIPSTFLDQIQNIDLSTDEGKETLNNWIKTLFDGRLDYMGDLSPDEFTELLNFLQGLPDSFDAIPQSIDTLQDAIDAFSARIRYGGVSVNEALESFIDDVREMEGVSVGSETFTGPTGEFTVEAEIPGPIVALLNQLANFDLTSSEGQDYLAEIIKQLFNEQASFQGDLSDEDYQSLLDFLKGLEGSSVGEVTRNVAGVASITEFTGNELLIYSEAQLRELEHLNATVQAMHDELITGEMSNLTIQSSNSFEQVFNFERPLNDADIRQISDEVARILQSEYGGNGF